MATGDGDRIDMSPLPGPGVTDDVLAAVGAAVTAARAAIDGPLAADVAAADAAVQEQASWAQVAENVVGLATQIVGVAQAHLQARSAAPTAPAGTHARLAAFLTAALPAALSAPDGQRGAAILNLLPTLLA